MSLRVNPFANLDTRTAPVFKTKSKAAAPVAEEVIDRIAEEHNFPSREAPRTPKAPKRKRRVYTTGRNVQFNTKAKQETVDRFHRLADERNVPLCELL
jgi:hypothetical protein